MLTRSPTRVSSTSFTGPRNEVNVQVTLTDEQHAGLVRDTRSKLVLVGVEGEPALHLLFEAQY
jgi:hypothetical protein